MLIRLMIEGDLEHLGYWVSAVILIPSFALASGVLTKTNRTFEILYMIIWYLGPLNKMPFLDFLGSKSAEGMFQIGGIELNSWAMSLIYIMISLGLLSLAYASRNRLAQTA